MEEVETPEHLRQGPQEEGERQDGHCVNERFRYYKHRQRWYLGGHRDGGGTGALK